jgi:hypothetical protein
VLLLIVAVEEPFIDMLEVSILKVYMFPRQCMAEASWLLFTSTQGQNEPLSN